MAFPLITITCAIAHCLSIVVCRSIITAILSSRLALPSTCSPCWLASPPFSIAFIAGGEDRPSGLHSIPLAGLLGSWLCRGLCSFLGFWMPVTQYPGPACCFGWSFLSAWWPTWSFLQHSLGIWSFPPRTPAWGGWLASCAPAFPQRVESVARIFISQPWTVTLEAASSWTQFHVN